MSKVISEVEVWPRKDNKSVLANARFTYDGTFRIKCILWKGKTGPFVGFPGSYGTKVDENGKKIFYADVKCLSTDLYDEITAKIVEEYNRKSGSQLEPQEQPAQNNNYNKYQKKSIPF